MIESAPFHGIIAAPHTPMHPDGRLNLDVVERQAAHFKQTGVIGAFIGGTTGESLSLSQTERLQLCERWTQIGPKYNLRIIVHVGANCTSDATELARAAQNGNAAAISAMAPSFFRPACAQVLSDYCAEIAAAASQTPFYFYHIPCMTNVNLSMVDFLQVAQDQIPSLRGMKFTHQDLMQFQECVNLENGRFDVLHGFDEFYLSAMAVGARGAVGSTYNFAAKMYNQMTDAFFAGEHEKAAKLQYQSVQMVRVLLKHGFAGSAKAVMGMIGIECGNVRSPLNPLSPEQINDIRTGLDNIGFFEWIK